MRLLLLCLLALSLNATPTRSSLQRYTQSDGSHFEGHLRGDAFMYWIEAKDGNVLLFNKKTATFEYALIAQGKLSASGEAYSPTKKRAPKGIDKAALAALWERRKDVAADQITDTLSQ